MPDIDLEISIIEDPVQSMGLLASGQLDLVTSTIEFGPIALAEDMPVKLLGLTNLGNGSDRIIVGPDIASPEDLKGKQVGVIEGGLSQIYMAIWLEQQGIKWNEVEMVNLFPDAAAAAMIAGQLSAAELWDPYGPQVLEELPGSREMSQFRRGILAQGGPDCRRHLRLRRVHLGAPRPAGGADQGHATRRSSGGARTRRRATR